MHELTILLAKYLVAVPVIALLYTLWNLTAGNRKRFVLQGLIAVTITIIMVKIATSLHSDPRPFIRDGVTPYFASSTDNGFPSDHTVFSALIGWLVLFWKRRLGIVLILLSLIIGTARVIAGVHHGQDIVGGFVIGFAGAVIGYAFVRYVAMAKTNR